MRKKLLLIAILAGCSLVGCADLEPLMRDVARLDEEHECMQKAIQDLQSAPKPSADKRVDNLIGVTSQLSISNAGLERSTTDLRTDLQRTQKVQSESDTRTTTLGTDVARLQEADREFDSRANALFGPAVADLSKKVDASLAMRQAMEANIATLGGRAGKLEADDGTQSGQIADITGRVDELDKQIKSSRTWGMSSSEWSAISSGVAILAIAASVFVAYKSFQAGRKERHGPQLLALWKELKNMHHINPMNFQNNVVADAINLLELLAACVSKNVVAEVDARKLFRDAVITSASQIKAIPAPQNQRFLLSPEVEALVAQWK